MGRKINHQNSKMHDDNIIENQEDRLRCGEIYYKNNNISFQCLFCKEVFEAKDHLFTFIDHLEKHLIIEIKTDLKSVQCESVDELACTTDSIPILENDCSIDTILNKIDYGNENEENISLVKNEPIVEAMDTVFVDCNSSGSASQNTEIVTNIIESFDDIITTKSTIYTCPRCYASYDVKSNLYAHWKEKHLNNNRSSTINGNQEQNQNIQKQTVRKKPITIKIDSKKLNSSYKIVKLKESKGDGGRDDGKRVCEICGKELSSRSSLILHMRTHTGEKPHVCNICGKGFACDTNLKSHIRMHLGDKKYKCSYCEKGFVQSSDKKIHERIMHLKDASHVCDVCGRGFYTATRLKYHVQRHTGEKPFECETCKHKFYNRTLLNDHMVSHTGLRPFECNLCEAKFARKKTLKAHERRHKKRT